MPFLFVYSPDDFVGGLPNEASAAAAGRGPFELTLKPGAEPTLIEVADDDLVFDEIDATQSLARDVTIDGQDVAANTTINAAYDLIDTASGHKVSSFHFGGSGYQQGAVDGLVSSVPLQPGETYTFNSERTSHEQNNLYQEYVACFAEGAMIDTEDGPRAVESLRPGQRLKTLDNGAQPLRRALTRRLSAGDLADAPRLRPVRICVGALGCGLPTRELLVSPQHRFLTQSPIARRMFGTTETLISARKLTALPGIFVCPEISQVTYHHLILDQHEIIFADGAPTESFHLGPTIAAGLPPAILDELRALFPDASVAGSSPSTARPVPPPRRQAAFVRRHRDNAKPIMLDW